jgi:hypothetical protein
MAVATSRLGSVARSVGTGSGSVRRGAGVTGALRSRAGTRLRVLSACESRSLARAAGASTGAAAIGAPTWTGDAACTATCR